MLLNEELRNAIIDIPDYPKKGVAFKDVTPVFQDGGLFSKTVEALAAELAGIGIGKGCFIAGVEARGFIIGAALALKLNTGFVPIRKAGKLPRAAIKESYELEYGTASIEMESDAMPKGSRVVIADDLLATGGTSIAAYNLVRRQGSNPVAFAFIVELSYLNGRRRLPCKAVSLLSYA
ncbi:MAG: adenine phosphoribosyltransferase [Candidatus Marsarchaeota archaeon]|nr:adenine phosphoribosyltransferase [Candidatus Marsarchaeota archaeon]